MTNGRIKSEHLPLVRKMYEETKDKFGFFDEDIVTDMWRILENRESVMRQPLIFKRTLREYREGKLNDIYGAYYARSAWARFLRMTADSPHYPRDSSQNAEFFTKMWELLGELWKRDIPMMKDIIANAQTKGKNKSAQRARNQAGVDQLGKLVDYGQKVLELLQDPLFQKMFAPPKAPKPQPKGGKDGADAQGQGGDGDGDANSQMGGDGQGTEESSLDGVQKEFRRWVPYMVEGVLFSQDLKMVTKLNPKGKWAPTPYPDNSIDVHKIQSSADLMKLLPGEHALPSDLFYLKYAKRELLCREFMAKTERRQILYVLLDVSGSMHGTKVMMVSSVVLALLRKVVKNGDHYFLRFFDARPSKLYQASDLKGAQELAEAVVRNSFQGNDTLIHNALMTAITDIKKATADQTMKSQMKDAQILLLTDGQDYRLNAATINAEKGPIKIHSVVVDASGGSVKELSDSYREIRSSGDNLGQHAIELVTIFDRTKKGGR